MSALAKAIRQKRFTVKENSCITLALDTRTGARMEFRVENCSINGMGAVIPGTLNLEEDFQIGSIIPAAKIVVGEQEAVLGRLTVRFRIEKYGDQGAYIGFATVDSKIPVDGMLSKYLHPAQNGEINPYDFELSADQFSLASFVEHQDSNTDLFARCRKFEIFYQEWKNTDKYNFNEVREASIGPRIHLKTLRKGDRSDYIQMTAYDYLNLGSHPKVIEAAVDATRKYGYTSGGSPVLSGTTELHERLEHKLAQMLGKQRVILFNSGYAANVATLQGLTTGQDLIVADMLSHASLHDGMRMSPATSRFFKHNNMAHLEKVLVENRPSAMGALIVTEGVFSMDGDMGDIRSVVDLAKAHNARVMVDEAHSFGLYGKKRNGISELVNRLDQVDIYMSSLSKVCGAGGGFIAANQEVIDWLTSFGRARVFSGSMPASSAAAGLAALELIATDNERVERLFNNVKHFVRGMRDLGAPVAADHNSPIVPVVIGDERKIGPICQHLKERGIFVVPIVYPAVGKTQCRFRFSLMSEHSISDLDYVISTFEQAMKNVGFSFKMLKAA